MISVNQLSLLTPVPEITEYDSSFFDIESSLCKNYSGKNMTENHEKCKNTITVINEKNKELRNRILDIENKLHDTSEQFIVEKKIFLQTNHECFSKLAIQLEKYKLQCSNLQLIHEDHVKQVESLQLLFKQETLQREYIEKQLLRITSEFQDYAKTSEEKIKFYSQELKNKENEISLLKDFTNVSTKIEEKQFENDPHTINLQTQLHNCIDKLQESEYQRKILQKKLESVAEFHSKELEELIRIPVDLNESKIIELNQEIKKYKQKCSDLENLLDDKYVEIKFNEADNSIKNSHDYKAKNLEYIEEINLLKEQLAQERRNNNVFLSQIREKNCKEIENKVKGADDKFMEYLKNYGIDDKFEKVSDGLFMYGGKKVSIAIKNGCLICRVGGGYMGIEKFIKSILNERDAITPLTHKRSQTAVLKEKSLRDDSTGKSADRKPQLIKLSVNSKENSEDLGNHPKTVVNKVKIHKETSFTPGKEKIFKRVYK